ncbi:lytic transglycosylase domain-containing protein [Yoonia sp.]|uniref:lytic transglycosylase domain-containing protein n=1 Tax=Yoonia sp. TaxID=2212373 RepID=UPI003F6C91C4
MRLLILLAGFLLPALPVAAQGTDPDAVAAIEMGRDDWDQAMALAARSDPLAVDVLTWMQLYDGDADFARYQSFLTDRPDWPRIDRLRAEGERVIEKGHDPAQLITWFADARPQTGAGALRLAEALTTTGQIKQAEAVLRDAWLSLGLTATEHDDLITAFGDVLAPFHWARTDAMLWRSRRSDAERMLPLLDDTQRAVAAARIGYIQGLPNMMPLYNAVPERARLDPGFAYARFGWMAARGSWEEATGIVLDRSTSPAALGEPIRWSGWRRTLARWDMREGRATRAYALASRHYLTEGEAFADLEWLSGYIALTYLGDPVAALAHFEKAAIGVGTPISLGRMHYWIGRAHQVLRQPDQAATAFAKAAQHQTGFYGLLAADHLGLPLDPALAVQPGAWRGASVFDNDLTRAALMLLAGGERGHAVSFVAALGDALEPGALAALGAFFNELDEQYYTLLLGKTAVTRGIVIPDLYFPVHDLAAMDLPVEPALALAVARRESEFNIGIGSPVGALGLMQLMPGTAEEVALELDLPYSRARLTSDWQYNAILGAQYLAALTTEFGNTPAMIAAGYNAGPSRPQVWMDERGDPRLGEMDVVDWIEHIPFRETRNYVMRVTEAIPVYRARLSGQTGPVDFTTLLVGEKPLLRPRARPLPTDAVPDVRPIARPEGG